MRDYTLTRTNRKTIGLYIRDGYLEIRAPHRTPVSEIDKFVALKEEWIEKYLAESKERVAKRDAFTLTYGDKVTFLGKQFPIVGKPGNMAGFDVLSFYMPPGLQPEEIKYYCMTTYRMFAERYLTEKALYFAEEMEVSPAVIRISNAKKNWGSCSAKKSICFSWMLMMADVETIDYIIVHELAHLIEHNHSERFWAIVEEFVPNYKEQQAKLKELSIKLSYENW